MAWNILRIRTRRIARRKYNWRRKGFGLVKGSWEASGRGDDYGALSAPPGRAVSSLSEVSRFFGVWEGGPKENILRLGQYSLFGSVGKTLTKTDTGQFSGYNEA